ncbi:MAG TPA: Bro-N domain-containing protein, partial [Thiotrichales bacterium]|nr:Bro-N domain-containing protein [Thiotrichales bacterium]
MSTVIPFQFDTSNEIRTLLINDDVWFVASDIAKALSFRNANDMTRMLDDDERGTHIVRTPSGEQEMIVINESGLYHALVKSRKPEAKPFRKWVTGVVLPSIRKTGKYEHAAQAEPTISRA